MVLLFFFLLLATFGHAEFASEVDCGGNRCFILVNCSGHFHREGRVHYKIESLDQNCDPRRLQMLVEIDTRSARRFDFRVFYDQPSTEMNITDLVNISTEGANLTMDGRNEDLRIYNRSPPSGGNGTTANFSSFRFTIEVGPDTNLFYRYGKDKKSAPESKDHISTKLPTGQRKLHLIPPETFEAIWMNTRCDPSDLVDYCVAAAAEGEKCEELIDTYPSTRLCNNSRMWHNNGSNDDWMWVDGVDCETGNWIVRRGVSKWHSNHPVRLFCANTRPPCEYESYKVPMIILGVYCTASSIVLVVLFVILYNIMNDMKGPSKSNITRTKGTQKGKSSGSSSGSSSSKSSEGQKANQRRKQKNRLGKEKLDPNTANAFSDRIKSSKKAKAVKKNQAVPEKKEEQSKDSGRAGPSASTDLEHLRTE